MGAEIVSRVLAALQGDVSKGAVNAPALDPKTLEALGGYLDLGEKLGRIQAQLLPGAHDIEVTFRGEFPTDPAPVVSSVLVGYLSGSTDERPNMINARALARERGLNLAVREQTDSPDYQTEVIVKVSTQGPDKARSRTVGGTVFGRSPRLTRLRDYRVELEPEGYILIASNQDKPGAVAQLSTLLGTWGVNIAGMALGRAARGGEALFTLTLDEGLSAEQLRASARSGRNRQRLSGAGIGESPHHAVSLHRTEAMRKCPPAKLWPEGIFWMRASFTSRRRSACATSSQLTTFQNASR